MATTETKIIEILEPAVNGEIFKMMQADYSREKYGIEAEAWEVELNKLMDIVATQCKVAFFQVMKKPTYRTARINEVYDRIDLIRAEIKEINKARPWQPYGITISGAKELIKIIINFLFKKNVDEKLKETICTRMV